MSAMSDYLENKFVDHVLGTAAFTMPAQVYLALFTDDPGDDASGTELSGNGYARQEITFGASSGGAGSNTSTHTFTAGGGDFGTVSHWAIFDALTGGNMLIHEAADASQTITDGQSLTVAVGAITVTGA